MMGNTDIQPLISIIVPVYNVKDYLEKCLQSICGQTYKNLEIIVVDDGSTDGSGEVCDSYAQKDSRIKVIHQANAGQSVARNKALSIAQGEYLGFVDGDDWIEEDMYEFLFCAIAENDADISICSHYRDKGKKSVAKYSSGELLMFTRDEAIRALVVDKRVRNYVWDKLYKRCLFIGIAFPSNRIFEDIAISYQVFYRAKKIVVQEAPKYHYTIRDGSAMQSRYNPSREYDLFQGVYEQVCFVLEKNIWDRASVYVLRRGVRLIDHISMLQPSSATAEITEKVLAKMHEFDNVGCSWLGISLSLKRYFIFHYIGAYQKTYRFVRTILKSKRHKF